MATKPQWEPDSSVLADTSMAHFTRQAEARFGLELDDYSFLHQWSVDQPEHFWGLLWDYMGVISSQPYECVVKDVAVMPGAKWFPGARLNFAENLLVSRECELAVVFRGERGKRTTLSGEELYQAASRMAKALIAAGVEPGDRVAGYLPNIPEAVISMLAVASIGAVWSSCSPDFGAEGVVDRFGQIEPKILISTDGYLYNGKSHEMLGKLQSLLDSLPSVKQVIVIPFLSSVPAIDQLRGAVTWDQFVEGFAGGEIRFVQVAFDHPLYILYSSGTTGTPKCIVHGHGGTLLQHLKEHRLHVGLERGDRLFYFTTCGWMMWNWLASALASKVTLVLYDGSPFFPDEGAMFDLLEGEGVTHFGTSAKYLAALDKTGLKPSDDYDLSALGSILSTGSPLSPDTYDYVYHNIKKDLMLSSISGGTDIVSCFVLGNPMLPVWPGELQCIGLGMKVEVLDDEGHPLTAGQSGELCCTQSFPSMPVAFWDDPEGLKYHAAYFGKYPGIWCHGDWVSLTEHGGMIIYGRSDATLNPGGVRIGTAEIYRQAEKIEEVLESLAITQRWKGDERIVLFVRLRDGFELDEGVESRIRQEIRSRASPRHVPSKIVQVSDIPRTKSGKIVEIAVKKIVHNERVSNREALANPEALTLFANLGILQSD